MVRGIYDSLSREGRSMTREEIDNIICEIMINDGPDGHVDGHEVLTDFVMSLLESDGDEWSDNYLRKQK